MEYKKLQTVVGVRFKKAGRIFYFSPGRLELEAGDLVIVRTVRGTECATIAFAPREVPDEEVKEPLQAVQRKVTENDLQKIAANRDLEKTAFETANLKIAEHHLPMKLINVECTFDMSKIIFYFMADGRVDFRELVKDLASAFRTRIELRQVGVRDQARLLGGIGGCGRPLCCATFLSDFAPVSIRMAKDQNLSLNPTKISGICGRLMCCLRYEDNESFPCENCCGAKKEQLLPPKQGSKVMTVEGSGKVISVNVQRRSCTILLDNRKTIVTPWEDAAEIVEDEAAEFGVVVAEETVEEDIIAEPFAEDEDEAAEKYAEYDEPHTNRRAARSFKAVRYERGNAFDKGGGQKMRANTRRDGRSNKNRPPKNRRRMKDKEHTSSGDE